MSRLDHSWNNGDMKPVEPGFYRRRSGFNSAVTWFDGVKWCVTTYKKGGPVAKDVAAIYQNKPWKTIEVKL